MNIKENFTKSKGQIYYFVCLILVCTLIIACTSTVHLKESVRSLWLANAFYIPLRQKACANFNYIERYAFFGREYADTTERPNILPDTVQSPPVHDKESIPSPEPLKDNANTKPEIENKNLLPIIETDLAADNLLFLNNTTAYKPNTSLLIDEKYDFGYRQNKDEILVLVLHTHATECYSREGSTYYDKTSTTRSTDTKVNMVSVGKAFAERLNENGIGTLHCTTQHDADSYSAAYSNSARTVKDYLKEYPSIKYVFDLHRDAVVYQSGAKAKAVCETDGEKVAQIMLLVGSDAGGANFPHWRENLTLALKLARKLETNSPRISRSVALRGASYNQQYTNGSLLVEIGTDGNTLSEAINSAEILADSFSSLIKGE